MTQSEKMPSFPSLDQMRGELRIPGGEGPDDPHAVAAAEAAAEAAEAAEGVASEEASPDTKRLTRSLPQIGEDVGFLAADVLARLIDLAVYAKGEVEGLVVEAGDALTAHTEAIKAATRARAQAGADAQKAVVASFKKRISEEEYGTVVLFMISEAYEAAKRRFAR